MVVARWMKASAWWRLNQAIAIKVGIIRSGIVCARSLIEHCTVMRLGEIIDLVLRIMVARPCIDAAATATHTIVNTHRLRLVTTRRSAEATRAVTRVVAQPVLLMILSIRTQQAGAVLATRHRRRSIHSVLTGVRRGLVVAVRPVSAMEESPIVPYTSANLIIEKILWRGRHDGFMGWCLLVCNLTQKVVKYHRVRVACRVTVISVVVVIRCPRV